MDNKGRPYETSAKVSIHCSSTLSKLLQRPLTNNPCLYFKVPFIMRYPAKIPAGRIIHKTWSSIDFGERKDLLIP